MAWPRDPRGLLDLQRPIGEPSSLRRETDPSSPWLGISCAFEGKWLDHVGAVWHLIYISFC